MNGYHAIKLTAEIVAFVTLTVAFLVIYSLKDIILAYVDKKTFRRASLGALIFWAGYLENVLNDVYSTEFTKIFDDVLVAIGMATIMVASFQVRRQIRAVKPKMIMNGHSSLTPGAYITEVASPSKILSMLQGKHVLAITRYPKPYAVLGVPYIWISNVPAENSVRPTDLAILLHKLLSSVDENTFVIIDGLEYLILNNGFDSVMKFLTSLKDHMISKNAGIVVVVEPKTLDNRQMNLLLKEFSRLPS